MVDIVQQVSTDIVLSDKSEAEAGTNNTKFMTPLRTKEAIDKNLVPFNAMSQSQFEAIRAANNEEFAASGFVHFGKHGTGSVAITPINEGLYTYTQTPNILEMGRGEASAGKSKTDIAVVNIAGVVFHCELYPKPSAYSRSIIKFPQAPDGKTTYNKSTGVITNHDTVTAAFNAQAADPTNVEVVTDRVDMWGFEAWLEEVSVTNPYVYPNGLIQSQATTMDGIATSASARPVTYYAVFDGDTTSKGKGVNFVTLTDAQKKKALGNHKNNLYYLDDGRLVQWRLRQRTFAGAGNGDFFNINVAGKDAILYSSGKYVNPQGAMDSNPQIGKFEKGFMVPPNDSGNRAEKGSIGHFTSLRGSLPAGSLGVGDECYFLCCGTVNRLNQGAYHPSFNPSGTAAWRATQQSYWCCTWDNRDNRTKLSGEPSSKADCFTATLGTTNNGGSGGIGTAAYDGYNRPDKRFHDAIYADGFGGVCRDMRYSAYGLTPTDFADADQRVKNGTYRGFEKVVFMKLATFTSETAFYGKFAYDDGSGLVGCSSLNIPFISTGTQALASNPYCRPLGICSTRNGRIYSISGTTASGTLCGNGPSSVDGFSNGDKILVPFFTTSSVGGSFLQTDVIGDPANILATPQLANGWQGSWIPVIPDGTSKAFTFTRKISGSVYNRVATSDNGGSWASASWAYDAPNNSATGAVGAGDVRVYYYQAFAKQTENAVNAVVYGGNAGVGSVIATSDSFLPEQNRGVLLKESLTSGKRGIGGYTNGAVQGLNLIQFALVSDKLLSSRSAYDSVHPPILIDGNTSADAVKALNYNVNINKQAFIQYAYTELKHSGTNWGDDSKITIVDNQATKTDLNGNTVLVGTAKLKEPIGWIKNKV